MVNPNIQYPVDYDSRGLVIYPGYEPVDVALGDPQYTDPNQFSTLLDAELVSDNRIESRRPIKSLGRTTAATRHYMPIKFLGTRRDLVVSLSAERVHVNAEFSDAECQWHLTSVLTVPGGGYNRFEAYHYYNAKDHFVAQEYNSSANTYTIRVFIASNPNASNTAWASFTSYTVVTGLTNVIGRFVKSFVFRDRLWIVTTNAIYFSKSTDFSVWTVTGGSQNYVDQSAINDAVPLGETIYVIQDSSIYAYTYANDPNDLNDVSNRIISTTLGADSATVYAGNVYFYKNDNLYQVNSTGVTKVLDVNIATPTYWQQVQLVAWENYLVIRKYLHVSVGLSYVANYPVKISSPDYKRETSLYFLNMDTGAMHACSFRDEDQLTASGGVNKGWPIDIMVNPVETLNNDKYLYILTASNNGGGASGEGVFPPSQTGYVYGMNVKFDSPRGICDTVRSNASPTTTTKQPYYLDVIISSIAPDTTEFNMKKFKSMEFAIQAPKGASSAASASPTRVAYAFDDRAFGAGVALTDSTDTALVAARPRPPYPYRLGINQRAHTINLRFYIDRTIALPATTGPFLLGKIVLLWGYTKRAMEKASYISGP